MPLNIISYTFRWINLQLIDGCFNNIIKYENIGKTKSTGCKYLNIKKTGSVRFNQSIKMKHSYLNINDLDLKVI